MSARIPETLVTLLLAAVFGLAGDLVLARRSSSLREWIESFLVGAGVSAAALFPLSLALPGRGLGALASLLAAAAVLSIIQRRRAPKDSSPRLEGRSSLARDPLALALFSIAAASGIAFLVLNWRYVYLWDGFQIWASKAQVLFYSGDLAPDLIPGDYFNSKLAYPPLVPMFEALLSMLRGGFDFDALKPPFALFYLAMAIGTYHAARPSAGRTGALAATALLCLLPAVSTGTAAGGYADLSLAAYVAAVAAAFLGDGARKDRALPWLIACLTTVKSEGAILAVAFCAVALVEPLVRHRRPTFRAGITFAAPTAVFLFLRISYVRWIGAGDTTYAPINTWSLGRAFGRIPDVLRLAAQALLDWKTWGLFWAVFLLAAIALLVTRSGPGARTAAAATLAGLAAYTAVFLFTNWPVRLQVEQAYPRLLQQLAPAAAVVIVLAYAKLREAASAAPAAA